MVIGRRRGAGKNKLSKTDARSRAQRLLVDLVPICIWHRAQPLQQRNIDAGAHALEHALEEMMMRRDQAGIDHAARSVDHVLAVSPLKRTDRCDAPVRDANCAARAHGLPGQPREYSLRAVDEGHVSAPISLSCHSPSASLESPIMVANSATPASVMRKSAANMRGMSSWNPDCSIS